VALTLYLGLGSGLAKNPTWAVGFTGSNVGGLIVAAYAPLGAYGKFCAVMMYIHPPMAQFRC
jgi:hypothetical protein